MRGYHVNLNEFYPGVNALTLATILVDLANRFDDSDSPDPDIEWVRRNLDDLRGSLILALDTYIDENRADYWTLASFAEMKVLTAKNVIEVSRAYRKALTASRRNTFFLQSSLGQLEMLRSLEMRTEFVEAGIQVIKEEMRRMRKDAGDEEEKKKTEHAHREGYVFLFTGYMVNNSRKKENHFPPEKESDIKKAIQDVLEKHNAGPDDLAITTGMDAGSEIVFVETCVERGIPVRAYFPALEAPYVRDFVSPGGEHWVERFYKMRNHPLVDEFYQPEQVGMIKDNDDVNERNNRWALYSSLARGIDKVRLIAVWDGKNELSHDLDARLVKHMIDLMRDTGGIVEHINPFKLSMDSVMTDIPDLPLLETDTPSQSTKPAPVKLSPSSKPKSNKKK
ncbi:MAG: hypothetical protein ABI986_06490, partial [Chloroflexota bacterium]